MRLMYLRVKGDCSLFKDIEICFNPEWRFTIDHDVINCQRYEEFSVPQNFYSTGSDTPVEAVNVFISQAMPCCELSQCDPASGIDDPVPVGAERLSLFES